MDRLKKIYIEDAKSGEYEVCIWGAGFLGTERGLQLLYKKGISIDCYCDNNRELWGKEIVDGIQCISPEDLQKKAEKVICFLMIGSTKADSVLQQMKNMGIEKVVLFNDLFAEEKEACFPFMKSGRIAVYTCIVGEYDELQEPLSILSECDYYLISDKKPERETIFQYIDIEQCLPDNITDNTRKNRFCKINAHKIFPKYRYSVYFDGQIQIDSSVVKCIAELPKTRITTMCRSEWHDSYMQAMGVLLYERDTEEVVKKQVEQYWLEGMPEEFGNVYCGILLREHNNPVCRKLMEDWWEQVERYSKRDMISFPYIIWKNGYTMNDVNTIADKFQLESKYWKAAKVHNRPRLVYQGRVIF